MSLFLENCKRDRCTTNGILKIGNMLQSQNGIYRLVLNQTGNLEIWCKREKLWTTNTNDNYVESLIFNSDGKIHLLGKDNSSRWQTSVSSNNSHLMLLQNDGNLAVYNECGNRFWNSNTSGKCETIPGIYSFHKIVTLENIFLRKSIPAGFVTNYAVILVANLTVQISLIHLYTKIKDIKRYFKFECDFSP